jgi:hypothetical protein
MIILKEIKEALNELSIPEKADSSAKFFKTEKENTEKAICF